MKTNKKGISLIVLVITIIVMIILASAIILSLGNTGIMDRAEQAVDASDIKQVQTYASTVWAEAYLDGARTKAELKTAVTEGLKDIDTSDYAIIVTTKGVEVRLLSETLGGLVKSGADYGKTVNYTANGVTDWKVFYKQKVDGEEYVYLITSDWLPKNLVPTDIPHTVTVKWLAAIQWNEDDLPTEAATIQNPTLWMANWNSYSSSQREICASYFLDETYWADFKNSDKYGDNVIAAVGAPTPEMFVASWNAKGNALNDTTKYVPITLTPYQSRGYYINNSNYLEYASDDSLYVPNTGSAGSWWLAGPSGVPGEALMRVSGTRLLTFNLYACSASDSPSGYLRPIVCLKATTPAHAGTGTETNIVLD